MREMPDLRGVGRPIETEVGRVQVLPPDEWVEMAVRCTVERYHSEADWLASLPLDYFEQRWAQFLAPPPAGNGHGRRRDIPELYDRVRRMRRFEGVHDRSFLRTSDGRPTLPLAVLMYKGGEILWRLLRGDTHATLLKAFGSNAAANDIENAVTYTSGVNNLSVVDIGTATTTPAATRNTVQTLDANATGRHTLDSGFWKIKTVSNTPVLGSNVAQLKATFASGEMPSGTSNIMAWNEFAWVNATTRTATWNDFANVMLDLFVSQQGSKQSTQVWVLTLEYTLGPTT